MSTLTHTAGRRAAHRARPGTEAQDAYFAIEQFTSWINSADTKGGFLAAALALLVNGIVLAAGSGSGGFRHLQDHGALAVGAFGCAAVSAVACTGALVLAVFPRVRAQAPSRYSWPSVSLSSVDALVVSQPSAQRREAWTTARSLALIAQAKYRYLRVSFACWLVSLASLVLSVLAS